MYSLISIRGYISWDSSINGDDPVFFLDISKHHPVSLFGCYYHSAVIGCENEVIFINHNSVINSPNSPIAAVSSIRRKSYQASCAAMTQSLFWVQTAESSHHQSNQTASSTFLLFQNFQVKKFSVCQAHTTISCQQGRSRCWTWIKRMQTNSTLVKEQN